MSSRKSEEDQGTERAGKQDHENQMVGNKMYQKTEIYGIYGVYGMGGQMLRKTTVYLSEEDLALLRKKATVRNVTVAEVIRTSIQEACQPRSKEEREIWDSLDRLWAKTGAVSPSRIEAAVNKAVKEVRGGRKARRRT